MNFVERKQMNRYILLSIATCVLVLGGYLFWWRSGESQYRLEIAKARRIFAATEAIWYSGNKGAATEHWKNGEPYSWRVCCYGWVSLVPFRDAYDPSLAWNSEANVHAATGVILDDGLPEAPYFAFVMQEDSEASMNFYTPFLRIDGPDTFGEEFHKKTICADGLENTILFVINKESKIFWTAPMDLLIDSKGGEEENALVVKWLRSDCRIAIFGDGSIREIARNTALKEFIALCTRNGREPISLSKHRLLKKGRHPQSL